jgi:phage terminase large subunit-like protein
VTDSRSAIAKLAADNQAWTSSLTHDQILEVMWDWPLWARPQQLAPNGDWSTWLVCAGRGFGKTRTGAEWARQKVAAGADRGALVAATAADIRDVMVEGESGILSVFPKWQRPKWEPSKRRVTFHTGAIATTYSADEPDRLRGPQHEWAWADELAAWRYADAWDQLQFGLRLGKYPQSVVTTTPRPTKVIRDLINDETVPVSTGSTYDNAANLAASFLHRMESKYEGTRLGRQELHAELLEDVEGALWKQADIDRDRVRHVPPNLSRIVVAVDPAITSTAASDETGIIVAGATPDRQFYILTDASARDTPDGWVRRVVAEYEAWSADVVYVEANQGGDAWLSMISNIDPGVNARKVHASLSKRLRAEPVAALYEQSRVHHVGAFDQLEDQCCTWDPHDRSAGSPDRIDALVWAIGELDRVLRTPDAVVPFGTTRPNPWKIT